MAAGDCAAIADDALRLACYDRQAGRPAPAAAPVPAGRTPDVMTSSKTIGDEAKPGAPAEPGLRPSFLSKFWDLDAADKRGRFNFTGYRPNYLLPVHVTSHLNSRPSSPNPERNGQLGDYDRTEAKFQISLRTKVAEGLLLPGADVWLAYTQQAIWQLYNGGDSRPFHSIDHEPEAMYVVPVPESLGSLFGWRWRYGMLAAAHQSNGQAAPLSRSWNRIYAGAGFERGDLSVVVRAHHRLREDAEDDDNSDLTDYRGRGDIAFNWTPGLAAASLLWRTNFRNFSRGSVQLDWSYPVASDTPRALRWYAQVFSGYGESLLDYNFRQTSVGVGLALFEF